MTRLCLLAAAEALRFVRRHGVVRAVRLGVGGLATLGPRGLIRRAAAEVRLREDDAGYRRWIETHTPGPEALSRLQARVAGLPYQPGISIITAVFNTNPAWLRRCVESVQAQVYSNWQLCLCDDGSTSAATLETLQIFGGDHRIRIARSPRNGGVVYASNAALALATGDFVGFLDHDDELAPDALAEVVWRLNAEPETDIVYTDEDKIDEAGARRQPHFKPDWSPELLRSCMYVSHFTAMRRRLVESVGAFRPGTDGAQDYDLMLRATEASSRVAHVPKVLYHWRMVEGSAAASRLQKRWAMAAGRRGLEDHLRRRAIDAEVRPAEAAGHYRVRYAIIGSPLVSILIPVPAGDHDTERFSSWLRGFERRIGYRRYELHVVHGTTLNAEAQAARGDHLLLLHPFVTPRGAEWIPALLELSQQPDVGAVGGVVLNGDDTIDNAGLVLGQGGVPLPAFRGEPAWTRGHLSNILDVRNCSALSGACLMTRRWAFERAGGFDETAGGLYDVDYCLRLQSAGLRNVITPYARVRRSETAAAPPWTEEDLDRLRSRWPGLLDRDPYYNPNFDRSAASFRLRPIS